MVAALLVAVVGGEDALLARITPGGRAPPPALSACTAAGAAARRGGKTDTGAATVAMRDVLACAAAQTLNGLLTADRRPGHDAVGEALDDAIARYTPLFSASAADDGDGGGGGGGGGGARSALAARFRPLPTPALPARRRAASGALAPAEARLLAALWAYTRSQHVLVRGQRVSRHAGVGPFACCTYPVLAQGQAQGRWAVLSAASSEVRGALDDALRLQLQPRARGGAASELSFVPSAVALTRPPEPPTAPIAQTNAVAVAVAVAAAGDDGAAGDDDAAGDDGVRRALGALPGLLSRSSTGATGAAGVRAATLARFDEVAAEALGVGHDKAAARARQPPQRQRQRQQQGKRQGRARGRDGGEPDDGPQQDKGGAFGVEQLRSHAFGAWHDAEELAVRDEDVVRAARGFVRFELVPSLRRLADPTISAALADDPELSGVAEALTTADPSAARAVRVRLAELATALVAVADPEVPAAVAPDVAVYGVWAMMRAAAPQQEQEPARERPQDEELGLRGAMLAAAAALLQRYAQRTDFNRRDARAYQSEQLRAKELLERARAKERAAEERLGDDEREARREFKRVVGVDFAALAADDGLGDQLRDAPLADADEVAKANAAEASAHDGVEFVDAAGAY
jgi:hypothetical protein